jgi:hypothetical protein
MKIKIKYYRQGIPYITDRSFPTEESAIAHASLLLTLFKDITYITPILV